MRYYFPAVFLLLFLSCISLRVFSTNKIQSSDKDYYIHKNPSFSFIFSEDFLKNNKRDFIYIHQKLSYYDDIYKEIFTKNLKEIPIYVFASSKNQISNAITSGIPFLRVLFFPTGVEKMTNLATTSWEDTSIAHEMAHTFQLGQMSDSLKYIKPIFKNSEVIFLPIPIFLSVNLVMPLFLLEGHAVLSESLFAPGGRLYSGFARALVFTQIKNAFRTTDQFIKNYLINVTKDTFSIQQYYNHGGYFFNSLLQKYDIKTINNIFKKHSEHFIIPFSFISIKSTFESVFKTSFESLVNHYIQKYLPLAKQQNSSPEKVLFKSHICPPFNKAKNEIFFLTSDLKSTPLLRTLNLSTKKWKKRKKVFSPGKVFKIKNRYYVSSSSKISTTEMAYGLFAEGMYLTKYKSQSVQDIYKDQILSIDTSNNIHGFNLLLNGKFYDTTNSPALFGPKGSVYYFKQKGDQRVMYKNKFPVFQFRGFYGKPVEVDSEGTVYFISASPFGSSLFAWTAYDGVHRLSPSDVIIDAIKGPNNQFLVCEIEPEFYTYKLISIRRTFTEKPVFYEYPFETISNSLSTLSSLSNIKTEQSHKVLMEADELSADTAYLEELEKIDTIKGPNNTSNTTHDTGYDASNTTDTGKKWGKRYFKKLNNHPQSYSSQSYSLFSDTKAHSHHIPYSSYNSLMNISFSGVELGAFRDPITEYNGIAQVNFQDPMEYNSFHLAYQQSFESWMMGNWTPQNWMFQTKYMNKVYRLAWDIQYTYKQGPENFAGSRTYSYIHEFSQGILFPIFKSGYWSSSFRINNSLASLKLKKKTDRAYYFSTEPSLQLQYRRAYKKNFHFHRQFLLKAGLQYRVKISPNNDSNYKIKARSHYTWNWGSEFYTTPFINYQTALKLKSIPFRYFKPLNLLNTSVVNLFLEDRLLEQTNKYLSTGMDFQKFIDTPVYFSRYPISLRGIAPSFKGKYFNFLDNNNSQYLHFAEWTFGVKVELLFHHKVKFMLNLYSGYTHALDFNFSGGRRNLTNKQTNSRSKKTNSKDLKAKLNNNFQYGIQLKSHF